MRTIFKPLSALFFTGILIFSLTTTASAQRGFHGGGGFRGGFRGGFGGPRYSYGPRIGLGIGIGLGGFRGYYNTFGYPRVGFVGALPYGYYPFAWGANQYYYAGGVFYQPGANGGYQVTTPPVGAEVPSLPKGANPINIDGNQYYEYNGVYYKDATTPDNKHVYLVAGKDGVLNTNAENISPDNDNTTVDNNVLPMPHVGDMTDQLPEGSRKVSLNNKKYWVTTDNIYLEEVKNGDRTSYRVVSIPGDDQNDK